MNEVSTAAAKQRSNCSQQKLTIGLDLGVTCPLLSCTRSYDSLRLRVCG